MQHSKIRTDRRSPCPMLNALSNHGILPRSGVQISKKEFEDALNGYLKLSSIASSGLAGTAIARGTVNPIDGIQYVNLNTLQKHNDIEHDVSLSRLDSYFGNSTLFSPEVYSEFQLFAKDGYLSYDAFPAYRHHRENLMRKHNPEMVYGVKQQAAAYAELAILYLTFEEEGRVSMAWLDVFFEEERLPFELGWMPREVSLLQVVTTIATMRIKAASL